METVEDILREMREGPVHACFVTEVGAASDANRKFRDFADRIDAAYKRDLQAMCAAGEIDMRTAMGEVERLRAENARLKAELNKDDCLKLANDVDRLREENARLKAALKPVLDYDYKQTCDLDDFMAACHCMNIINEAQRIYNGGNE